MLAQAPGSVNGRFKVTEQGEVIFARYGHMAIARRHIEQVTNAVLLASTSTVEERTADAAAKFRELADQVATASERAYRGLTEAPGFPEWFSAVSPLEEIGSLRLGSRPARRGLGAPKSLDDLRAIPWVFAWAQTRVNLPGWYGLGSGLAAVLDAGGQAELREAYKEWPLFASLLDNVEMSLAKTDRAIASRYLALGGRDDFFKQVMDEYDLTRPAGPGDHRPLPAAGVAKGPVQGRTAPRPLRRRAVAPATAGADRAADQRGPERGRAREPLDAATPQRQRRRRRTAEHGLTPRTR